MIIPQFPVTGAFGSPWTLSRKVSDSVSLTPGLLRDSIVMVKFPCPALLGMTSK